MRCALQARKELLASFDLLAQPGRALETTALRSAEHQEPAVHAQYYGLLSKQGVAVVHPYAVHEAVTSEVAARRRSGS